MTPKALFTCDQIATCGLSIEDHQRFVADGVYDGRWGLSCYALLDLHDRMYRAPVRHPLLRFIAFKHGGVTKQDVWFARMDCRYGFGVVSG